MSGHNKWSSIKHRKGAQDTKRSKIFSRLVKEIHVAVKEGGADVDANPRLRLAIQNAKGVNMPKDNIERAISKASGSGESFEEVTFEGYAPHGVGVFVECLTDNHQRTVGMVRSVFNKRGGNLSTHGSLSFMFERKGVFTIAKDNLDPEEFELEIIDAGVDEIDDVEDKFILYCPMEEFGPVQKKLEEMNITPENAELQRIPTSTKELDKESALKVLKVVEELEELDDVQNVYHNLEASDELVEAMNS